MYQDLFSEDTSTKELVKPVATKEFAKVSKGRSGGSARSNVGELQMQSADVLQPFSCVRRIYLIEAPIGI